MERGSMDRRGFLKGAAGSSLLILPGCAGPRSRFSRRRDQLPPSEKINIASVGAGGQAGRDLRSFEKENIVALCDVDDRRAAGSYERYPKARRFRDFRRMFDRMDREIDAVLVATPDHTHAVAVMAALERGKHVYCEKPLAHTVHEARQLTRAARDAGVVTQLGNQGHSSGHIRLCCEWIWDGAIGNVSEVHAACSTRPDDNRYSHIEQLPTLAEEFPIPEELDWDFWLGPVPARPYNPAYVPRLWRGWTAFGSGALGDWFCHVADPAFWALGLGAPESIESEVEGYDPGKHGETFPPSARVTYRFPAKGERDPVRMVWYDGKWRIPHPEDLESGREPPMKGAIIKGDKGEIMHGSHGAAGCRIIPEEKMKAYELPEPTLPRVSGHHQDWLDAIREGRKAGSDFSYGGPLSEAGLLGAIALRFPGQKLEWDSAAMKFTNSPEASAYINLPYRHGWHL